MTKNFIAPQHDHGTETLCPELEALWKALNTCDYDTYLSVISCLGLGAAGSQPA